MKPPRIHPIILTLTLILLLTASTMAQESGKDIAELSERNPDLALAETYFGYEDWEAAADAYEIGLRGEGVKISHLHNYAYALLQLNRYGRAERVLRNIIDIDGEDALAWSNLGFTYYITDRDQQALRCFERAVELRPQVANNWYMLGFAALYAERIDRAWEAFDVLVAMNEESAERLHGAIVRMQDYLNDPLKDMW